VKINGRSSVDAVVNTKISEADGWCFGCGCHSTLLKITYLWRQWVILAHTKIWGAGEKFSTMKTATP